MQTIRLRVFLSISSLFLVASLRGEVINCGDNFRIEVRCRESDRKAELVIQIHNISDFEQLVENDDLPWNRPSSVVCVLVDLNSYLAVVGPYCSLFNPTSEDIIIKPNQSIQGSVNVNRKFAEDYFELRRKQNSLLFWSFRFNNERYGGAIYLKKNE